MSIQSLQHTYKEAKNTDNRAVHHAFVQQLLEDTSDAALEFHYRIMQDPGNAELQQEIASAYRERGQSGCEFLLPKLGMPIPAFNKASLLQVIGMSGHCSLLRNILPYINDPSTEVRQQAIAATGWLGDGSVICYLKRHLFTERSGSLRASIVKAMMQIHRRGPSQKESLTDALYTRLQSETDAEAMAASAFALQELTGIEAGMAEDQQTGAITGNAQAAREALLKKDQRIKA